MEEQRGIQEVRVFSHGETAVYAFDPALPIEVSSVIEEGLRMERYAQTREDGYRAELSVNLGRSTAVLVVRREAVDETGRENNRAT